MAVSRRAMKYVPGICQRNEQGIPLPQNSPCPQGLCPSLTVFLVYDVVALERSSLPPLYFGKYIVQVLDMVIIKYLSERLRPVLMKRIDCQKASLEIENILAQIHKLFEYYLLVGQNVSYRGILTDCATVLAVTLLSGKSNPSRCLVHEVDVD